MSKVPHEELQPEQEVWVLRDDQIAKFWVESNKGFLLLRTDDQPPKFMPGGDNQIYLSEKNARVALIQIFEEDLRVRERRLSAARAGLNQLLREQSALYPHP
jgi:hypothetical protein